MKKDYTFEKLNIQPGDEIIVIGYPGDSDKIGFPFEMDGIVKLIEITKTKQ